MRKDLPKYCVLKSISRKFVFFPTQIAKTYQKLDKFTNKDLQFKFSKQVPKISMILENFW